MTTEREKADLGAKTISAFMDQFGSPSDPKVHLFLEVLLKELFNAKTVSLFGKPQQAGDQTDFGAQGRLDSDFTSHGLETPRTADDLGTPNITNN